GLEVLHETEELPEEGAAGILDRRPLSSGAEGLAGRSPDQQVEFAGREPKIPHDLFGRKVSDVPMVDFESAVAKPARVTVPADRVTEGGNLLDAGEVLELPGLFQANVQPHATREQRQDRELSLRHAYSLGAEGERT